MIEFCGELSEKSKKFIQKDATKIASIVTIVIAIIFSIPTIVCAIKINWVFVFVLPLLCVCVIFASIPQINSPMKLLVAYFPKNITIQDDTIFLESEKLSVSKPVNSVKKVIDSGDLYYLIFSIGNRGGYFLCQKDLITQGTLEEFENLFSGKIIRKPAKKEKQK